MRATARVPALLVLLLTVACGAGEPEGPVGADEAEAPADEPAGEQADEQATEETSADLAVASSDLGDILVDPDGMTLYLFTEDPEGESVCEDACAQAWPPLLVDGDPVAGEGVDAALLGTTDRGDGGTQVTYGGWPLYTWAQDQQPGDVTGQGVQDVWYVVSPDARPVTDEDDDDAPGMGY